MKTVIFKPYTPNQLHLLPPSWDEKIVSNHPVRIVDQVIDHLDLTKLYNSYEGGGASSYHPKMLLKATIFAYINNIYSSRKIEEAIKSNIHFIWLCGNSEPDHNTINRFRGERVAPVLKDIFKQIVLLLAEEGLVSLQEIYVDGTKMEANANRYTFVWGKAIKTNKENMVKQLDELWRYAQSVATKEFHDIAPLEFPTIDPEKVRQTIKAIEDAVENVPLPKKIKQKLTYVKKKYPEKLEEYERKEELLAGRNSYSKTDTDATFMRMKEDHMMNGQLKPGYNMQISTNNQIIVNYDSFPNPTDTRTLPEHVKSFQELYGHTPNTITADSGYGSEENYEYLEKQNITAYVKYNLFHQEQRGTRAKKYPFAQEQLYYNTKDDYYVCPMGQRMNAVGTYMKKNYHGYTQMITRYQAQCCDGCPMRGVCHRAEGNRNIEVNHRLMYLKAQARDRLTSDEGIAHRNKRAVEVETVFGNIKQNKQFRRFNLRGKEKTTVEFGFIAIAHNLMKKVA